MRRTAARRRACDGAKISARNASRAWRARGDDFLRLFRPVQGLAAGQGSFSHLMSERMLVAAGVKGVHVPFQGGGPLVLALMAGQVDATLGDVSQNKQQVQAGKLKLLGVASAERTPLAPGVPTLSESGIPGFAAPFSYGFFAPAGTRPELVARINTMISEVVNRPDIQKKIFDMGYQPKTSSPEEFKRFIDSEVNAMGKLIDTLGLPKSD